MNDTMKDLTELLPWVMAFVGIVGMSIALRSNKHKDTQDTRTEAAAEAAANARLEAKLDTAVRGIEAIQLDFKAQQRQISEISDRLTRCEESTKEARREIAELKEKKGE
jgi:chromosome segregation ATPase